MSIKVSTDKEELKILLSNNYNVIIFVKVKNEKIELTCAYNKG